MQLPHRAQSKLDTHAHPDFASVSAGRISLRLDRRFPVCAFQENANDRDSAITKGLVTLLACIKTRDCRRWRQIPGVRYDEGRGKRSHLARLSFANAGSYRLTGAVIWS